MESVETQRQLVAADLAAVDDCIRRNFDTDIGLITQLSEHIIASGGKRIRPLLTLLSAKACNYTGNSHILLAAVIEFIHTATLLHDDVVDASDLRRGKQTANKIWGNEASVLVGDYLYSRAFQLLVDIKQLQVMGLLATATNGLAESEVCQLMGRHNPDITEAAYTRIITGKTAMLFSAACECSAVLAEQPAAIQSALADFGLNLGIAFQLIDDALDFNGDTKTIGKNLGDDLADGCPTLPLIMALKKATPEQQACLRDAIKNGNRTKLEEITTIIHETGALEYTFQCAREHAQAAQNALCDLPPSQAITALHNLAQFVINRSH